MNTQTATRRPVHRGNVEAFIKAHNVPGMAWKVRTEPVLCACHTGDSGYRTTYSNGRYDVLHVEQTKAGYRQDVVPLVDWPDGAAS